MHGLHLAKTRKQQQLGLYVTSSGSQSQCCSSKSHARPASCSPPSLQTACHPSQNCRRSIASREPTLTNWILKRFIGSTRVMHLSHARLHPVRHLLCRLPAMQLPASCRSCQSKRQKLHCLTQPHPQTLKYTNHRTSTILHKTPPTCRGFCSLLG
jgi:hypothetical protein